MHQRTVADVQSQQRLPTPGIYFDEINGRLADATMMPGQRESFQRMAQIIEWKDHLVRQGLDGK